MANPAFVSATGATSGGTNTATVTTSGGAVPDGRLMYALAHTGGAGSAAVAPPAGWTTVDTGTMANGWRYGLFWKIASSEGTTQAFVSSDATYVEAYVVVVSDPNASPPNDATPAKNTGTASTMTFGDITSVTDNALSLLLAMNADFYPTMPGGSYTSGGHSTNTISAAYATKATAGLITGLTGTGSGSGWATYSIAVKPVTAGGSAAAASGVGTASGTGAATTNAPASASGSGVASGTGASQAAGLASSTGSGVATGVGASAFAGVGNAAGVGTATGVGNSTSDAADGSAAGTSTASGVGASIVNADGAASGTSTASATGEDGSATGQIGGAGWGTPGDFPTRKKRETAKDIRAEIDEVIARFEGKAESFHVELQKVEAQPVLYKAPAAPDFSPLFAQLSSLTAQLQAVSARQAAAARAQVLAAQERAAQLEMQAALAKAQQRKRRAVMIAANYFFKD